MTVSDSLTSRNDAKSNFPWRATHRLKISMPLTNEEGRTDLSLVPHSRHEPDRRPSSVTLRPDLDSERRYWRLSDV